MKHAFPLACLIFCSSSFFKSPLFYIHILTLFAKIFFAVPILIPDLAKHFLHAAVLVLVPTKCSGLGHKRLTLSPGVLPSKLGTLARRVYTKKANTETLSIIYARSCVK
jgi:hypothetical protein